MEISGATQQEEKSSGAKITKIEVTAMEKPGQSKCYTETHIIQKFPVF